jgi:oxygen-independent coproporphyrinogen-3 oxidase
METRARKDPDAWRDDVNKNGHGLSQQNGENAADFASEAVMMGLRLQEGIRLDRIETRSGPRAEWLNEDELQHLCRQGLLSLNDDHLALTYDGKAVMNTVIGRLLT